MRHLLLMSAVAAGLVLCQSTVQAQPATSGTQYPPAPNASSAMPQALNSLPRGAATSTQVAPGGGLGGATPVQPAMNTLHPLHPPRHQPARRIVPHRRPARPAPATTSQAAPAVAPATVAAVAAAGPAAV